MDSVALDITRWSLKKIPFKSKMSVLDVGSMDINGNQKVLLNEIPEVEWDYIGIDIEEGKNVDMVVEPYNWPFTDDTFDLVLSSSCIEHVEDMYAWADEVIRVIKKGGYFCLFVPALWTEHKCPLDCWRIYPDGMRWLFSKRGKLEEIFIGNYKHNGGFEYCYGIFKKGE